MQSTQFKVPSPINEPIFGYLKGSKERGELKAALASVESEVVEIPCVIAGKEIRTGTIFEVRMPHDHQKVIARVHLAGKEEVAQAIEASLKAKKEWESLPWYERAKIFLKAADLLAGPWRARLNAATMHGQSKNAYQAEIDAACELADFLRFNASFYERLLQDQPFSPATLHNSVDYRPLEGFVLRLPRLILPQLQGIFRPLPRWWGTLWSGSPPSNKVLRHIGPISFLLKRDSLLE